MQTKTLIGIGLSIITISKRHLHVIQFEFVHVKAPWSVLQYYNFFAQGTLFPKALEINKNRTPPASRYIQGAYY